MSRLGNLVAELCPDGVPYMAIGNLCTVRTGSQLNKDTLHDTGLYPVYNGGIYPSGYHNDFNSEAGTIAISQGGANAGFVNWVDVPFFAGAHCYTVTNVNARILNRFIYFYLKTNQTQIQDSKHGAGIPGLNSAVIKNMKIPLPPLPIQEEIVRILDRFITLEAELEAELEARKKQYEYYRKYLLTINNNTKQQYLREIAAYSKDRINANCLNESNYIGVDNLLAGKRGRTVSNYVPGAGSCTKYQEGDILIGNIRPYLKKIWRATCLGGTNGDVLVIRPTDSNVDSRYLYHLLSTDDFFAYNMQHAKGAKMPRGSKDAIMNYPVSVPSFAEQERIVSILDRFDTLVNDITQGLPAEIVARRKQYEYYRDKLLTFKEKES